jgi:CDP-L-myo-inositol myo-inositolphosphotransferase
MIPQLTVTLAPPFVPIDSRSVAPHSYVVLLPDVHGRTLFGEPVHARNARVAARAGAMLLDADAAATLASGSSAPSDLPPAPVLIVPPTVAINTTVFPLGGPGFFQAQPGLGAPGAVLDVSTPAARRRAAWHIVKQTGKAADGWVSRRCNRPISRLVSYLLLARGLRANHASAMTLLVGLIAAAIGMQPGYLPLIVTGVLFHLASVLDGVDGEMARATLTESNAGARIDTLVDQATYVACFAGVTIGWIREAGAASALGWTLAVIVALLFSLWRGGRFVARYAPNASYVFIDRSVRRAARETGKPPLRLAAALFTLLRRDLFAALFLVVALFGVRAAVPALVATGVVIANLTFTLYSRELVAAALAERSA